MFSLTCLHHLSHLNQHWSVVKLKVKHTDIAVRSLTYHTATGTHMPYGITQCYLPPDRGDIPAFTPAEAGTRLSDPGWMQGWVDLVCVDSSVGTMGTWGGTLYPQVQDLYALYPQVKDVAYVKILSKRL